MTVLVSDQRGRFGTFSVQSKTGWVKIDFDIAAPGCVRIDIREPSRPTVSKVIHGDHMKAIWPLLQPLLPAAL